MNRLPPPNYVKDANNFSCQEPFYRLKAYPHTELYLRWAGDHWIVDGWYPSGGWSRSCHLTQQARFSREVLANPKMGETFRKAAADLLPALEKAILRELSSIANGLSPENLTCDGERAPDEVERVEKELRAQMDGLLQGLGRTPTAAEVYGFGDDHPLADVAITEAL